MSRTGLRFATVLFCAAAAASCSRGGSPSLPEGLVYVAGGRVRLGSAAAPESGGPREADLAPFALGRFEVTVARYCRFLDDVSGGNPVEHPQIEMRGGTCRPRAGEQDKAVAWVGFEEAEAYCRWLSKKLRRRCRLPTEDEWELAARAGVRGAPYPWGWGDPRGRAAFDRGSSLRVGMFPPNRRGLHDMAGGVAEWCAGTQGTGVGTAVRGGSWTERDPDQLTVFRRIRLPRAYRDADVGFRIAAEVAGVGGAQAQTHR